MRIFVASQPTLKLHAPLLMSEREREEMLAEWQKWHNGGWYGVPAMAYEAPGTFDGDAFVGVVLRRYWPPGRILGIQWAEGKTGVAFFDPAYRRNESGTLSGSWGHSVQFECDLPEVPRPPPVEIEEDE